MMLILFSFLIFRNTVIYGIDTNGFSIETFITSRGFSFESHEIQTKDGYLLTVHRIPNNTTNNKKGPLILMHGLLGSSENYIIADKKALAFAASNEGYDVWMPNARGNMHSRKHTTLNPDKDKIFWKFSWHEIGIFDLPSVIDYILEKTNHEKLLYVGHSQGCTSFFVMASELEKYQSKIKVLIAMAPAVFMNHFRHPLIRMLVPYTNDLTNFVSNTLNDEEFVSIFHNEAIRNVLPTFCVNNKQLCRNLLTILAGQSEQADESLILNLFSTAPAGSSIRQIQHYGQNILSGYFQKFNFGTKENLRLYNSTIPPSYKLENVKTPVYLFSSQNDLFADMKDIERLEKTLPNTKEHYKVPVKLFTHLDFLIAKDLDTLINNKVLDILKNY